MISLAISMIVLAPLALVVGDGVSADCVSCSHSIDPDPTDSGSVHLIQRRAVNSWEGEWSTVPDESAVRYAVSFRSEDGRTITKTVQRDHCQDQDSGQCNGVSATNNFASYTFQEHETWVDVTVTRSYENEDLASHRDVQIRPRYFYDRQDKVTSGDVFPSLQDVPATAIAISNNSDYVMFKVRAPCQLSVEIGGDEYWFQSLESYNQFDNLMLFFNPPKSKFPHSMPTLIGNDACTSSSNAHCMLAPRQSPGSCSDLFEVPNNTDLYFSSAVSSDYEWSDSCSTEPKKIILGNRSRVFLDDDVVIHARVLSKDKKQQQQGVIGYGVFTLESMQGRKTGSGDCQGIADESCVSNTINLFSQNVELWGFVLLQSTFRNIRVGPGSAVRWTKSFSWPTETDCANLENYESNIYYQGNVSYLVENNFFKNNDDCLKGYTPGALYNMNVIWHQAVGRVLMFNWGNAGENDHDIVGLEYRNTFVIHDRVAYDDPNVQPSDATCSAEGEKGKSVLDCANVPHLQMSAQQMEWYSAIICGIHSLNNQVGTVMSPVHITNLFLESFVGAFALLTNGYTLPGAAWMARPPEKLGVGNMHVLVDGLHMKYVKSLPSSTAHGLTSAPSLISGCDTSDGCLCAGSRADENHSCRVNLTIRYTDDENLQAINKMHFWKGERATIEVSQRT